MTVWPTRASDTVTVTVTVPTAADAAADATLARLAVSHGGAVSPLTPAFSSDATDYRATAGPAVAQVTVEADASQSGATLAFEDAGGAALADANADTAGHQVALAPGGNVVRVRVTASNGTDSTVYTLRLIRQVAVRLTALSVTGPDGRALALAPRFSPNVVRYRAVAASGDGRVTVQALAGASASVSYSPADADSATAGYQAALTAPGRRRR